MNPRRFSIGVAVALMASASLASPTIAAPPVIGDCNILQIKNNSWVARNAYTTQALGWITTVSASISYYNYALCQPGLLGSRSSSSGAWVAIEGSTGEEDIVQDGYIKCHSACYNWPASWDLNLVYYFWAAGQTGDILHFPWPVPIGPAATSGSHTFVTRLRLVNGAYQWQFLIDGTIRATTDDSWRNWNRDHVQIATELWNCGDQMGGRSASGSDAGNKQKFRSVTWNNFTAHSGGLGASFRAGNVYPWSNSTDLNSSDFDVWTSLHATTCSG